MTLSIKEIKARLENRETVHQDDWFLELKKDGRKGVAQLLSQHEKTIQKELVLRASYEAMSAYEKDLQAFGKNCMTS